MIKSPLAPLLNKCDRQEVLDYFQNSWFLEDLLMKSIIDEATFYLNPDPLRNPLIFYLGHSAVFYINKLRQVNILDKSINSYYESLFEVGVDASTPAEINQINWPPLGKVWEYREQAYQVISEIIKNVPFDLPIYQNHRLWALMMAIEHQRIHFETSSMLIRQLPREKLKRPLGWEYAPSGGKIPDNQFREVKGGVVEIGKPKDSPYYGWDSEYGYLQVEVKTFLASQYKITNGEFREFVASHGYENPHYWDKLALEWREQYQVKHPKFWLKEQGNYQYRAMFDEIELPLDWPVEVNYHEAMAYCRWRGKGFGLMSEAQWNLATLGLETGVENYNLNLKFGSPSPVGMLAANESSGGLFDLRGNVWEWIGDDFYALPGFASHYLYEDNAVPFFNDQHKMMLGGAWITTGSEALRFYRNWFRPYFYQHAGFRIVAPNGG